MTSKRHSFAQRRKAVGYTQESFAERLGVDRNTVVRWEAGDTQPQPWMRPKIAQALKVPVDQLGRWLTEANDLEAATNEHLAYPLPAALCPDDQERLTAATRTPGCRDPGVVHALSTMLATQRRTEDLLGSLALLGPVTAQLTVIERLVAEARGKLQMQLLDIGAQWAQFAGWLHTNAAQPDQATRLYGQALGWAVEVDNIDLAAEVISLKGYLAWTLGDMKAVIRLSQAAQRDQRAFPGQHAISAAQEARVHAVYGDADATDRKLGDALDRAALAAERPEDAPPWLYYHSPAFFTLHIGRAYRFLGRNDPDRNRRAIQELTRGIKDLPEDQRYADWTGEYLLQLALAYVQTDDIDQACALAREGVAIARHTNSPRLSEKIDRLHAQLVKAVPKHPAVAELGGLLRSG